MPKFPLTSQQTAMLDFIGGRVDDYYMMAEAFRATAALDVGVLRQALESVMRRHDVIRSVYPADDPEFQVLPMSETLLDRCLTITRGWEDDQEALAAGTTHICAPLDLTSEPPLRMWLGQLANGDVLILVSGHHLVFDAWSFMLFYEDLAAEYRRVVEDAPERAEAVQYAQAQMPVTKDILATWSDLLDRPYKAVRALQARAVTRRGQGAVVHQTWRGLGREVTLAAKARGVTPYVMGASAMLTALADVLGDGQVIFGTADAGRRNAASVNTIGYYSTTLFVGADIEHCDDLVSQIDLQLRRWHKAPRIQWEDLLEAHRAQDLYPVKFAFQPTRLARPSLSIDGVDVQRLRLSEGAASARRPIDVIAGYDTDSVEVRIAYRTDALEHEEAESILDGFGDALRSICIGVAS